MSRSPVAASPLAAFADLLDGHIRAGTRPNAADSRPWTNEELAALIPGRAADGRTAANSIANWRKGRTLPGYDAFEAMLRVLFGNDLEKPAPVALREAYGRARLPIDRATLEAAPREADAVDFEVSGPRLVPVLAAASDAEAAAEPAIARRLATAQRRLRALLDVIGARLDNYRAWAELPRVARDALAAAEGPVEGLPERLIDLYDNTVSLGSFVDQDNALGNQPDASDFPLDADIRRALADYLGIAAPLLRHFPSVLAWDWRGTISCNGPSCSRRCVDRWTPRAS